MEQNGKLLDMGDVVVGGRTKLVSHTITWWGLEPGCKCPLKIITFKSLQDYSR